MTYDFDSPLSEGAQDSLINAYLRVGGRTGSARHEALEELRSAGYITAKWNLTESGVQEGVRLWEHFWGITFERKTYRH